VGVASMTGFARAQGEAPGISWVWEVKSVNGRAFDLRLRLAPGFDALEPPSRATLAQRFRRGNFSANLAVTRTIPPALRVNREALSQLINLINELSGEIEAAPPRLDGLLALRGVVETVEDEDEAVIELRQRAVLAGWTTALDQLAVARAEEGARIGALLRSQLDEMVALVAAVLIVAFVAAWHVPQIVSGLPLGKVPITPEAGFTPGPIVPPELTEFLWVAAAFAAFVGIAGFLLRRGAARPGLWAAISAANARTKRGSSIGWRRTWLLKSQ